MSVDRFAREWVNMAGDPAAAEDKRRRWSSCNVFYSGRTIYSYGTHFPMGYILSPGTVWLNGDRYSSTTSRHQSTLRAACQGRVTAIIVPGSALDGAGIDYSTIEPVHIERERFDYIPHEASTAPAGMRTSVPDRWLSYGSNSDYRFTEDSAGRPVNYRTGEPLANYAGWIETDRRAQAVTVTRSGDVLTWHWHTIQHWLGDSVFTAEDSRTGARHYWLSSFDRQESRPLYFLSRLPGPADTVDAAIESLAPDSVRSARLIGRTVVRQGDIFAIETMFTTRQLRAAGARFTRRAVDVQWNRRAREDMAVRDALRSIVDGMPRRTARVYWDQTLSRGAHDALSQWHAERAEEWETETIARYERAFPNYPRVSRWSIESTLRYEPRVPWDQIRTVTAEPLLGTAHTATEVATMPDGIQYARGCMYHEPAIIGESFRARDHARRALSGSTWFLIARNTVPVTGPGTAVRRAS